MDPQAFKQKILSQAESSLRFSSHTLVMWLGGSTATGHEDELSDTDICVISKDAAHTFDALEKGLPLRSLTWKVEKSIWENFTQKFYVFTEGPETYYLDFGVFTSLDPQDYVEFLNTTRHGEPQIIFDKISLFERAKSIHREQSPPQNSDSQDTLLSESTEPSPHFDPQQWQASFEILYRTTLKEALRGKFIDAFHFYQRLVNAWIQLQRLYKTPAKRDFGARYLYRDLSVADTTYIESLLQVQSVEELQKKAADLRSTAFSFLTENFK